MIRPQGRNKPRDKRTGLNQNKHSENVKTKCKDF